MAVNEKASGEEVVDENGGDSGVTTEDIEDSTEVFTCCLHVVAILMTHSIGQENPISSSLPRFGDQI